MKANLQSEKKMRWVLLIFLVIALGVTQFLIFHIRKEKKEKQYLVQPTVGDVYLVHERRNTENAYYFLKVAELWEDSIILYHSSFEYSNSVREFDKDDFFVLDEQLIYTRHQLQSMHDRGEIETVARDYSSNEGFDRMKY